MSILRCRWEFPFIRFNPWDIFWMCTGREGKAEKNPFRFALFVAFFPQLLQGPIGRFSRLGEQLYAPHSWEWKRMEEAFERILWGFFKKMVVADTAAIFVNALFDEYQTYPGLAVFAALAYSVQLYGDFSGGIDVVIGISKLFGITLDENFKRPYFARSVTDFWHRWHITLGTWMKDYIFYPVTLCPAGWDALERWQKKLWEKRGSNSSDLSGESDRISGSGRLAWSGVEVYCLWPL